MSSYENYIAYTTIVRKEVVRFFRIWPQTLLPPVITQSLYFLIFGKFIGTNLDGIQGISYMSFIIPGLVMMAVINSSFANVVSSFFSSKFQRSVEELLVSSTPDWVIVAGYATAGTVRGLLVGFIVLGVSAFFAHPRMDHMGLLLFFMILTAVVFSLGGFLNAVFAKKFDDVSIFPTFVLTPLTYLGGVFYSIQSLPPSWQNLSHFNPILYMVNGFRFGFYGISDVNILVGSSLLIVLAVVLSLTNLLLLKRGTGLKT